MKGGGAARISPDIESLHHHGWEFWEERRGHERGGVVGEGKRGRQEERVWWKRRRGAECVGRRQRRKKGGGGAARAKAEARFTSPRIPASFYRPRDD